MLSTYNGALATGPVYLDREQIVSLTLGQRRHASTAARPRDCTSLRLHVSAGTHRRHATTAARLRDCTSLRLHVSAVRIDCTPLRLHVSTTARL